MPGADHPRHVGRSLETERCQRLQRARIVLLAGEDEIALDARQFRLLLEEARIAPLDGPQRALQPGGEARRIGKAQHEGDALQLRLGVRQIVGLLVVDHLDAVLDIAQKPVGLRHLVGDVLRDPVRLRQRLQRHLGLAGPERRHAAAGDQLLRLGKELDLANAAPTELDVVTLDRDRPVSLVDMDLPLDRMDVGDRRIVEILAEDEGHQLAQEILARGNVAGHGTGLDEGRPLPVLAAALVIQKPRLDRHRQRRRAGIGPKPEIGAEDIAVGGALLEDAHQAAHHPAVDFRPVDRVDKDAAFGIEEDDDVDVGGIVELVTAELAHADDDQAGSLARSLHILEDDLAALVAAQQQVIDGRGHRRVGKPAEVECGVAGGEDAAEIGQCHDKGKAALGFPQRRHHLRLGGCLAIARLPAIARRGDQFLQHRLQRVGEGSGDQLRRDRRAVAQIGRQRQGGDQERLQRVIAAQKLGNRRLLPCGVLQKRDRALGLGLAQRPDDVGLDVLQVSCSLYHGILPSAVPS